MASRQAIYENLIGKGALPHLVTAIAVDNIATVTCLLERNADLIHMRFNTRQFRGLPPLAIAAAYGRIEIMRRLIDVGADVNADDDLALMIAARFITPASLRRKVMKLLIDSGADVNPQTDASYSPLVSACEWQNLGAVQFLLANGADPNACVYAAYRDDRVAYPADWQHPALFLYPRNSQISPLRAAVGSAYRDTDMPAVIEALIEAGAEYSDDAVMAIYRGRISLLEKYLDKAPQIVHAPFDTVDYDGSSPLKGGTLLHTATEYDQIEMVKLLLARGADINIRAPIDANGVGGQTPIFHSFILWRESYFPLLEYLIEQGADLTVKATVEFGDEKLQVTPFGYALAYQSRWSNLDGETKNRLIEIFRRHGAPE